MTLTSTNEGTYYDYLKSVIEESLNNFLEDTSFTYTPSSGSGEGGPGGGSGDGPGGDPPSGDPPSGDPPDKSRLRNLDTYETAADYIASLNANKEWITLDSTTKKYTISNVGDFVTNCKKTTKSVGAFDSLGKTQAENKLHLKLLSITKHYIKEFFR